MSHPARMLNIFLSLEVRLKFCHVAKGITIPWLFFLWKTDKLTRGNPWLHLLTLKLSHMQKHFDASAAHDYLKALWQKVKLINTCMSKFSFYQHLHPRLFNNVSQLEIFHICALIFSKSSAKDMQEGFLMAWYKQNIENNKNILNPHWSNKYKTNSHNDVILS